LGEGRIDPIATIYIILLHCMAFLSSVLLSADDDHADSESLLL